MDGKDLLEYERFTQDYFFDESNVSWFKTRPLWTGSGSRWTICDAAFGGDPFGGAHRMQPPILDWTEKDGPLKSWAWHFGQKFGRGIRNILVPQVHKVEQPI